MIQRVTEKNVALFEEFIQRHPKGNFTQSVLWSKQKPMWDWKAIMSVGENGTVKGAVSVLVRKMPGFGKKLMYSCRGPVCDLDDKETLYELMDGLRDVAKEEDAYCIKMDPDVPSSNDTFTKYLTDYGFALKEGGKNFEAVQPRYVFRLNVEGKTEEEVQAGFHQKWRYNIRVAQRKGVEVKICGKEQIPAFADLMLTTGVRDGFVTRKPEYFAAMLDNMGEHARLYMAFYEGQPIAGTLAVHYGDKVWYLYGASSNEHRNLMPNYLLQWNMIQWAIEKKCRIYDFRGVSGDLDENNPLYGLYKFKKGFNSELTEFIGEYDWVISPFWYNFLNFSTKCYRKMNVVRYKLKNKKD